MNPTALVFFSMAAGMVGGVVGACVLLWLAPGVWRQKLGAHYLEVRCDTSHARAQVEKLQAEMDALVESTSRVEKSLGRVKP